MLVYFFLIFSILIFIFIFIYYTIYLIIGTKRFLVNKFGFVEYLNESNLLYEYYLF